LREAGLVSLVGIELVLHLLQEVGLGQLSQLLELLFDERVDLRIKYCVSVGLTVGGLLEEVQHDFNLVHARHNILRILKRRVHPEAVERWLVEALEADSIP